MWTRARIKGVRALSGARDYSSKGRGEGVVREGERGTVNKGERD